MTGSRTRSCSFDTIREHGIRMCERGENKKEHGRLMVGMVAVE